MCAELAMIGLVIVPLGTAVAVFLLGRRVAGGRWAVGSSIVQFSLTAWLTRTVLNVGPLRYRLGGWSAPLGIELYADGVGVLMLLLVAIVGGASTFYAIGYCRVLRQATAGSGREDAQYLFWPLWLMLWSALNALFLSGDIFNLYVTLELLTLCAVALIGLAGGTLALVAALRYLIAALIGSLFYLLGVALMYSAYGTVSWEMLSKSARADDVTSCAAVLMIVGLAVKTALFPLHFWLPAAHANAPAPVSGVLSGLVLKGSFFVLLRLWQFVLAPVIAPQAGNVLCVLGATAIIWGSIQAICQRRVKLMIAYSTVAQVGYLFLLFGTADRTASMSAWQGTVYFIFAHGCAKAVAFMVAGSLAHAAGSDDIEQWVGIGRHQPLLTFTFALAGVSLMGLPPSGGFVAKWLLLNAAVSGGHWAVALVIVAGGLLAAVYVFRVVAIALSATDPERLPISVPRLMLWPPLALATFVIACGVMTTEPIQLLDVGAPTATISEAAR
jgi:formate hydrogenlyase subunit 3/multisubunit Na+/H+ antiporter MnhD subunit